MRAFHRVTGPAVPLDRPNIDTDVIIPQQWLVTTERTGLGVGLFSNWRYTQGRQPDPTFVLNKPAFRDAKIIIAGTNYGCGSSREHAVWAHLDYGIEVVIAPSFGPIFFDNALKNGLLALTLDHTVTSRLARQVLDLETNEMTVDLETLQIFGPDGQVNDFVIDSQRRSSLLAGEDDIAVTLQSSAEIERFQKQDRLRNPWLWPAR